MTRILLAFGGTGQVGRELARAVPAPGWRVVTLDRDKADVTDAVAVARALDAHAPAALVNAAAYTAVDRAEDDAETARLVNSVAPGLIARAAAERRIPLVHISTDYVFDGSQPGAYREDDPVAPLGVYGQTKRLGEAAVEAAGGVHAILRTAWVFSAHSGNFVTTMLRLAAERPELRVVADQRGGPTAAADVADAALRLATMLADGAAEARGIFHYCGGPATTWHGFAEAILDVAARHGHPRPPVVPITTADYPTRARRPANSMLDTARIAALRIVQPDWRVALERVVAELMQERSRATPVAARAMRAAER